MVNTMTDLALLSFEEALRDSGDQEKFLILGNGFSVSWNQHIFSYRSLKESAASLRETTKNFISKVEHCRF